VHGELLTLGVKVTASTVWEILHTVGINPAPDRATTTWTQFLRSQAATIPAADFLDTVTMAGTRLYILAAGDQHRFSARNEPPPPEATGANPD
jgi:hypothetical protein